MIISISDLRKWENAILFSCISLNQKDPLTPLWRWVIMRTPPPKNGTSA